jgi:hypothetical protein
MNNSAFTMEELIRSKNPFAGHHVVRPLQIWGKGFPDVPSINAHASDAVFKAVKQVYRGERQTIGITITADKGVGKSHIISRIRHRFQADGETLFIYMSKFDNLNQIKADFLKNIASSLRAFGNQDAMQWQELAAALLNDAKNWNYTPKQYIATFPSWLSKYSSQVVNRLTDTILQAKPSLQNPYVVKAVLWTLSPAHANYAIHWLSGWELTKTQAEAMDLPNPKKEDKEAEALGTVRQILDLVSHYRIPIICFDELDTKDIDEYGYTAAMVVASLAKDLYNTLRQCVLLLAMYPETWRDQVRGLPQADAVIDRLVSEQADRKPIELRYLNSDEVVAIVSQWLKEFYEENKQTPPHPLYPFNESELREFGREKPAVRAVLKWCAEHFTVSPPPPPVESAYQNELAVVEESIDSLMEDDAAIIYALWLCFSTLIGLKVEKVKIEDVVEVEAKSVDQGYINFKIVGKEKGKSVKIGVSVIQQSGGRYVGAALKRLVNYEKFDLTRGCLVRSKRISPGARVAQDCVRKLLKERGGEWVLLQSEDIKPLLAILYVRENRESYELSEDEILNFIKQKKLVIDNPLIREILSDPSGQEPDNLTDEDLPMRIPQTTPDLGKGIELNL